MKVSGQKKKPGSALQVTPSKQWLLSRPDLHPPLPSASIIPTCPRIFSLAITFYLTPAPPNSPPPPQPESPNLA